MILDNFLKIALVLGGSVVLSSYSLVAQSSGWEANPEIIKQRESQLSYIQWHESKVPSYVLPEVLKSPNGTVIKSVKDWQRQRDAIKELFRKNMYGYRPEKPEKLQFEIASNDLNAMDGKAIFRKIVAKSEHQGRYHEFEIYLFLPKNRSGRSPVFLLLNNRGEENTDPERKTLSGFWPAEEMIARGYGIAAIQNKQLAPDNASTYAEGVIKLFEGDVTESNRRPDAWRALAAWGWGASRVMDYLETDPLVDAKKVAVVGHSRGGKAALWAGAEDTRFSLVVSNSSGCGGSALSRRRLGETVSVINKHFPHWFTETFKSYNDKEDELPFDQHMLVSLIAPRAVYVSSSDEDLWADPKGEFLSLAHASPVYALWKFKGPRPDEMPKLNAPLFKDRQAYHIRDGGHNLTKVDWMYFADFADRLWK